MNERRLHIIEALIKWGMEPRAYKELETLTGIAAPLLCNATQHEWFSHRHGKVWVTELGWSAWRSK